MDAKPDLAAVLAFYGEHSTKRMVPCPLHEDRTPSCSVNYSKQVWRCHSCGEGGDAYTLIEKKEGTDFRGAADFAAAHGLADGGTGGGSSELRGSAYGGRRKVARGSRSGSGGSKYTPSWRRG